MKTFKQILTEGVDWADKIATMISENPKTWNDHDFKKSDKADKVYEAMYSDLTDTGWTDKELKDMYEDLKKKFKIKD